MGHSTTLSFRTLYTSVGCAVLALTFGCGGGTCEEESPRQLVVVDAMTGAGVCAKVVIADGDEVVRQVDVSAVNVGTGACTGFMDLTLPEAGIYTFHIEAMGYVTLEKRVELAERGGCDYVVDVAFEGDELTNDPPLQFKMTPTP